MPAIDGTQGYRPPWVPHEFLPRLVPFQTAEHPGRVYMEPKAVEAERLTYPWRTNGLVITNGRPAGSGVLVGPNLMLTASHCSVGLESLEYGIRARLPAGASAFR
ncbi:V8-like Glu-specific endopeptidase [Streptomyces chartreusis NRRL 3882]|uniref:V8-like Glu-specific endopeptidase n=1 Tax=Streptomyces chartreusis NRRL 3882 TaxID=1079985 RepID=A0A2N9B028_STRCX|nr:V8-like Glu-specific endopeptidase [Streptomyces chartreusis NRRL 3882]